jgi:hypothetical protein
MLGEEIDSGIKIYSIVFFYYLDRCWAKKPVRRKIYSIVYLHLKDQFDLVNNLDESKLFV